MVIFKMKVNVCIVKFIYNEYIRPYFVLHVVSTIFVSDLPESEIEHIACLDNFTVYGL